MISNTNNTSLVLLFLGWLNLASSQLSLGAKIDLPLVQGRVSINQHEFHQSESESNRPIFSENDSQETHFKEESSPKPRFRDEGSPRPHPRDGFSSRPHFRDDGLPRPHPRDDGLPRPHLRDDVIRRPRFRDDPPRSHLREDALSRPNFRDDALQRPHLRDDVLPRPDFSENSFKENNFKDAFISEPHFNIQPQIQFINEPEFVQKSNLIESVKFMEPVENTHFDKNDHFNWEETHSNKEVNSASTNWNFDQTNELPFNSFSASVQLNQGIPQPFQENQDTSTKSRFMKHDLSSTSTQVSQDLLAKSFQINQGLPTPILEAASNLPDRIIDASQETEPNQPYTIPIITTPSSSSMYKKDESSNALSSGNFIQDYSTPSGFQSSPPPKLQQNAQKFDPIINNPNSPSQKLNKVMPIPNSKDSTIRSNLNRNPVLPDNTLIPTSSISHMTFSSTSILPSSSFSYNSMSSSKSNYVLKSTSSSNSNSIQLSSFGLGVIISLLLTL